MHHDRYQCGTASWIDGKDGMKQMGVHILIKPQCMDINLSVSRRGMMDT
jgi:hypothetical protein